MPDSRQVAFTSMCIIECEHDHIAENTPFTNFRSEYGSLEFRDWVFDIAYSMEEYLELDHEWIDKCQSIGEHDCWDFDIVPSIIDRLNRSNTPYDHWPVAVQRVMEDMVQPIAVPAPVQESVRFSFRTN